MSEVKVKVEAQVGSLSDRLEKRSEQLAAWQTAWFPIPGYEGIVEVELRSLGYKKVRAIIRRNEKVRDPDLGEIYTLADQLVAATVSFREVTTDGKHEPLDDDWIRLAKRRADCADGLTARQSLLFLVTDKRVAFLLSDWAEWSKATRADIEEEVAEDFVVTG